MNPAERLLRRAMKRQAKRGRAAKAKNHGRAAVEKFPLDYEHPIETILPKCRWDNQSIGGAPYVDHASGRIFHDETCARQYLASARHAIDQADDNEWLNDVKESGRNE